VVAICVPSGCHVSRRRQTCFADIRASVGPCRLRFEEFVKGFISMSVFHTAECWISRGKDKLEQVCSYGCLSVLVMAIVLTMKISCKWSDGA